MSTRCQIEFTEEWKNDKGEKQSESILLYRHCDGYPEGVIPDLKEFLEWNGSRITDIEYTAANFIFWSKRRAGGGLIGFGICQKDDFHGDIEFYYNITTKTDFKNLMPDKTKTVIKCYETPFKKGKLTREDFKLIKTIKI